MLAHVLAGGAYVLLRVRCTVRFGSGDIRPDMATRSRQELVGVGRFATNLARLLATQGNAAQRLEVDAILTIAHADPIYSIELLV